jgi:hypothetical protein
MESTGYTWGCQAQELYPGAKILRDSDRALSWNEGTGMEFWEVKIEANAHEVRLVFSGLEVVDVPPGYAPFVVEADGAAERYATGSTVPLAPPAE